MSDSVWLQRWQPTRLPHPWDSPGKNPGRGCHFLFQCMKMKSESEVAQACPTPSKPMDCSLPGSSVHGICQARVLEWVAISFSRKRSLVFPEISSLSHSIVFLYFFAFLSPLVILWNSAFKWVYFFFSPLLFASLLYTPICKASSYSHFAFLHLFFLGIVLIPVSCKMPWTSIHRSSGTLSLKSSPLNLFLTSTV